MFLVENEGRNTNIRVDLCKACRKNYRKQQPSVFFWISEKLFFGKMTNHAMCMNNDLRSNVKIEDPQDDGVVFLLTVILGGKNVSPQDPPEEEEREARVILCQEFVVKSCRVYTGFSTQPLVHAIWSGRSLQSIFEHWELPGSYFYPLKDVQRKCISNTWKGGLGSKPQQFPRWLPNFLQKPSLGEA